MYHAMACLTVPKLSYLGEHSEVSQARWPEGRNVVRVPVHFFSLPFILTFHWWPLAFPILSPPLHKISVLFFRQKNVSFGFSSSALNPCSPFSRSASLACRPLSLFLCLSLVLYSKFVDMTIYLNNTDTETISAFRFRLYWLFCCLCFTRCRWLCDFPQK